MSFKLPSDVATRSHGYTDKTHLRGLNILIFDERRIRQVLINLLNNAVKFTPEGGHITLEVTQPAINSSNLKPYLVVCQSKNDG